jgi:hypothetical protein
MTAYCRLMWRYAHPFQSDATYNALIVADRYPEKGATKEYLLKARQWGAEENAAYMPGSWGIYCLACLATLPEGLAGAYREYVTDLEPDRHEVGEMEQLPRQCKVLRDVFPNPFRPLKIDVARLTSKNRILETARSIYECLDYSELPVLGAMLARAGCTDSQILRHCDSKGPHVPGCWVVDLLLGKE